MQRLVVVHHMCIPSSRSGRSVAGVIGMTNMNVPGELSTALESGERGTRGVASGEAAAPSGRSDTPGNRAHHFQVAVMLDSDSRILAVDIRSAFR